MRRIEEVHEVLRLVAAGLNDCEISRRIGLPRTTDIRGLFCATCDQLGIEWRQMNARNISVARRDSVARMDEFIGPKR